MADITCKTCEHRKNGHELACWHCWSVSKQAPTYSEYLEDKRALRRGMVTSGYNLKQAGKRLYRKPGTTRGQQKGPQTAQLNSNC